ncbi:MAG: hypothetical protein ACO4CH_04090 [Saprospiraceae bacterium]|jgi:hypothetical protein
MGKDRKEKPDKPKIHEELEGFDISINEFGQIRTNFDVTKVNKFLNEHLKDKKLEDREDWNSDEEE